jgi:hypothetical protein
MLWVLKNSKLPKMPANIRKSSKCAVLHEPAFYPAPIAVTDVEIYMGRRR